jgi:hypothetical protein
MSEENYQRLAVIAREIEEHGTAIWLLERERDELRAQVRLLNHKVSAPPASAVSPGSPSSQGVRGLGGAHAA